ncbi:MAG: hypothetical protein IJU76_02810 [Desulfovibrionaceae bacterium]|nr:hypothetical protein [Desulfovibrionaceae bacterium]
MQLLRYIVRQLSPCGTPLRSDTLYGLLLTRLAERSGPEACRAAIDAFRAGRPPFLLSSILPHGMIFKPQLPSPKRSLFRSWVEEGSFVDESGKKLSLFSTLVQLKKFRKIRYLPLHVWQSNAQNLSVKPLFQWFCSNPAQNENLLTESIEPHVTIDRMRGTALPGGLFFNRLRCSVHDATFDIYAQTDEPAKLLALLEEVGDLGYGQDASTGKGRFSVTQDKSFDPTQLETPGPHKLLCSVCAAQSMAGFDGWYTIEGKRGKAGPLNVSPHKATMILVQEGSVLKSLPALPYILEGIHADPKIVQITHPLVLSCRLNEEESNG